MSGLAELIQDLRAHAHEAPATCAALMRRAASELASRERIVSIVNQVRAANTRPGGRSPQRHRRVKGAPCD